MDTLSVAQGGRGEHAALGCVHLPLHPHRPAHKESCCACTIQLRSSRQASCLGSLDSPPDTGYRPIRGILYTQPGALRHVFH